MENITNFKIKTMRIFRLSSDYYFALKIYPEKFIYLGNFPRGKIEISINFARIQALCLLFELVPAEV